MPLVEQILSKISSLDPVEREEVAFALSEQMIPFHPFMFNWLQPRRFQEFPSIVSTANVCGGAARLIRTRIPIWTLERMRQLGLQEIDIMRSYPTLRAVDLVQAWSYAARHPDEIEKAIRENEED